MNTLKFSLLFLSTMAFADEGMWLYNNLPTQALKQKYGFEPTADWTEKAQKASVRFNNGGSGSFISQNGLVLTNHHVAADTLSKLSSATHNLIEDGFLAHKQDEELKAPDLELNQLISIENVTARVEAAVKPEMTTAEAAAARRAVMAQVEKESFEKTGLRSDVVTLYKGGEYHLYRYKKYTDVRLVFAPEVGIAFFGGDPDNFEFPRYCLDMTLFRVYENGKPVQTNHYFPWSKSGPTEGELIFVSGNPGKTNRLFTTDALSLLRDFQFPYTLDFLRLKEVLLQGFSGKGAEEARQAREDLFYVQNSRKVYLGMLKGLQDPAFFGSKQKAEYALRSKVEADPYLKAAAGAWDLITQAQDARKRLYTRFLVLEKAQGFDSALFRYARTLVRMADEDLKKDEERLPEYRTSARASLEQDLFSPAPLYPEYETSKLAGSLSLLMQKLGENDATTRKVLAGAEPEERAAKLIEKTALLDPAVRKLLAKGGKTLIDKSYDPLILLAKDIDRASRKIRTEYETSVDEVESQAYGLIARALFTLSPSNYPDATFTLRLAFGVVKGYTEKGKEIPPFTTMGGAFEHEKAHGTTDPYKLPLSWKNAKGIDTATPFNFVSTADIIGGNSGSPVFNRAGELVGLIFDGNIHSLTANYTYSETQSRSIAVHSSAIKEALDKIYGATEVVKEISL